jgi:hypothetical protein
MSTFERIYQKDKSRESDHAIESPSIELSDDEHLQRLRRDQHALDIAFQQREAHEKVESKSPKEKPKADHRKPNKTAVARVQEKL